MDTGEWTLAKNAVFVVVVAAAHTIFNIEALYTFQYYNIYMENVSLLLRVDNFHITMDASSQLICNDGIQFYF